MGLMGLISPISPISPICGSLHHHSDRPGHGEIAEFVVKEQRPIRHCGPVPAAP